MAATVRSVMSFRLR
jgi:hypothetical protein